MKLERFCISFPICITFSVAYILNPHDLFIFAIPALAGVVFLDPPYCYISLIGNYVLGETFIGVCITIVVELFPARMRALAVGVYIFLIQNIGGNMEMFIPPLRWKNIAHYLLIDTYSINLS